MESILGSLTTNDGIALATRRWPVNDPRALVVLTHGFGEHSGRYNKLGATLSAAGFSLLGYDLRGHGRSQGRRGHAPSYQRYLDDLTQVVAHARNQMPGRKTFIFGHSMGGGIVLNYALNPIGDLAGIIATGPWLRLAFQPPAWKVAVAKLLAGVIPTLSMPTNLDARLLSHDSAVVSAYQNDPAVHGMISAAAFTGIVAAGEQTLANASKVSLPLLVMHGGDDGITDHRASEAFVNSAGSTDKTFKQWPGRYHEILNELNAEPIYAAAVEWLSARCS